MRRLLEYEDEVGAPEGAAVALVAVPDRRALVLTAVHLDVVVVVRLLGPFGEFISGNQSFLPISV